MKDILRIFLLGLGIAFVISYMGEAQSPAIQTANIGNVKIGFIDLQKAVRENEKGKQAIATLDKEIRSAQQKLDQKKAEIDRLQKEYDANKQKWDEATRQKKAGELKIKIDQVNLEARDYDNYYRSKEQEMLKPILEKLNKVIMDMGKKERYSVIFEIGGGVLYFDSSQDITSEVIKNFNAQK